MTTRKELIIKTYVALEIELKRYFDGTLFPSLDDIDVSDLVYFVTITFMGIKTNEEYQSKLKDLMKYNEIDVSQEVFDTIAPLVIEFISWLREL